jgi:hypothetical protein
MAMLDTASDASAVGEPLFRFSRCKRNHPEDLMAILGVPLPASETDVLCPGLPWHCYQVRHAPSNSTSVSVLCC